MSGVKHLVKSPVSSDVQSGISQGETACGVKRWDIVFTLDEVTCLRCRGTEEFYILELEGKAAEYEALIRAKAQQEKESKVADSNWLEVSGADGRDYSTARKANEAWRAGVEFQDNTTGVKLTVNDIGPNLNVVIRYNKGVKVTNAEMPAGINPALSESEAQAILENLSVEQAREWKTVANPDEIEIDLREQKPETD